MPDQFPCFKHRNDAQTAQAGLEALEQTNPPTLHCWKTLNMKCKTRCLMSQWTILISKTMISTSMRIFLELYGRDDVETNRHTAL